MFQLLSKKPPLLLGVDISAAAVKVVELGLMGTSYCVNSYGSELLPINAVVDKDIKDVEAVGHAIAQAIEKANPSTEYAAAAVSSSAVMTKTIQLPATWQEEEMASQIEVEASRYIPYPLEEISLDFQIVGENSRDPNLVDVLIAACRNENVELRVDALELAGLTPRVIDVESYVMERAFSLVAPRLPRKGDNLTVALVDIGATLTTLNVLHDHQVIYTREQLFGGRQLLESIQRRYKLTPEEAYMAERQGSLPADYAKDVLAPFHAAVAQQISRALQFFFSSSTYSEINYIVLSGGSASQPGLSEVVYEKVGSKVMVAEPLADMLIAPRVRTQLTKWDVPSLMISCGLALRSFDR